MRLIGLLLYFVSILNCFDDFDYSLVYDKRELVLKEGMILRLDISQKKATEVINFDFIIPPSDAYSIELIDSKESKDSQARVYINASYLLYPLKVGKLTINPHMIVKKASKEELKKFVTGSADELMYLRTRDKDIALDEIEIVVNNLDRNVSLVGNYTLDYQIDKKEMDAGRQVNIVYTIAGLGYKPGVEKLLDDNFSADIFADKEEIDKKLFHKEVFNYAIGGSGDFVIPEISLLAYNPKIKKYYTLSSPSIAIKVHNEKMNTCVMTQNEEISWQRYLNYLLLFLSGYGLQKLLKSMPSKKLNKKEEFIQCVKKSRQAKDLLKFLLSEDKKKFNNEINRLEHMVYHDSKDSLLNIKDTIIEQYMAQNRDIMNPIIQTTKNIFLISK